MKSFRTWLSNAESGRKIITIRKEEEKLENDSSTKRETVKEMQDCLHELNAQVDKVRAAGEKVREHENKCKRPENKYYY